MGCEQAASPIPPAWARSTGPGAGIGARRRGVLVVTAALGAMAVLVGCGGPAASAGGSASNAPGPNAPEANAAGDIPDSQVFVPFSLAGGTVTVSVPQGWAQSIDGPATVFTDKFNSVRIELRPRAAAPDAGSVRAQEVPQLRASTTGFVLGDVQSVHRAAGPAVLLTYQANSAPNPVTGKSVTEAVERYAFWRGGQQVVLTLSGPKGADNIDPWRKVTDSFRWLR